MADTRVGLGLRTPHFKTILEHPPSIDWFEALADNFIHNSLGLFHLEQIAKQYPISLHCVGISLGSVDPFDRAYLQKIKALIQRFDPLWVSDHLSWSTARGVYVPELLPMVLNQESLTHLVNRVTQVQEFFNRPIGIENPSSYMSFIENEIQESEFLNELCRQTGCFILLDINNIYVSGSNLGFCPKAYIRAINPQYVGHFHLAGFEKTNEGLLDTHGHPVAPEVWTLYQEALKHIGSLPTLIEWDANIPEFSVLFEQAQIAKSIMTQISSSSLGAQHEPKLENGFSQ